MKIGLHELCVEAVNAMVEEGIEKHVSYISAEDNITFALKEGGKVPKVTIEWVDESEAMPTGVSVEKSKFKMTESFNQGLAHLDKKP